MSGKRRSSARRPKVGIARRDGSQEKGKAGGDDTCGYPPPRRAVFAQRIRRGGSFQLPANTGCRQGSEGRGHGTSQARKRRSIIISPRHYGRAGTESAGRNPWPRPSNYHHRPPLKQKKRGFVHPPCWHPLSQAATEVPGGPSEVATASCSFIREPCFELQCSQLRVPPPHEDGR